MKPTQILDARRNIRKEIVAYLSILIIGMLASLSYLSVTYSAATLKRDALHFFNGFGLWDLELSSTMLLDEEDLEAIRALPDVEAAERVWQVDTKLRINRNDVNVSVVSLPGTISRPSLLEGRLPEKATECAVEKELLDRCGFSLGQEITLETGKISDVDPLLVKCYVITGVFQTPDHISYMVSATPYILVCEDSFNREGLEGAFMKIHIRVKDAPENRYSDEYWKAVQPVEDMIGAMAGERAALRVEKLRSSLDTQISEGRQKLADGRRQLEEGRRELDENREKLAEARRQLDEGWNAIREAERQLGEAKDQLDAGNSALVEAEYTLAAVPGYVTTAVAILNGTEHTNGGVSLPGELGGALQQYKDGLNAYSQGRMLWYSKGEEYLDALALYDKNLKQLEEGENTFRDAQTQLQEAEQEFADGEKQYQDGEKAVRDAEEIRDKLEIGRWVVLNNRGNPGYIYAQSNSEKLSSLSMSFSSIFLVVGALVIYATIGRMVEQQRKLIGATKALGLYNREIFAKYLFFACTATMLGVGLGILLAWLPLQRTILQSYEKLLTYGKGTYSFLPMETGLVVAGAFTISLVAVYLGCGQLLRLPAIQLMQGASAVSGQKKAGKSAKRNLYFHLIFRNMRTDWSRVLVTTVSIAGGCMLMVIGFTLRYGISGVPDRQFGGILTYDAEIFCDAGENEDAAAEIAEILDQNALKYIKVYKTAGVFDVDQSLNSLTMIVAEKGLMRDYFALRSLDGKNLLELPDSGALVPRRFSEYYGLGAGDSVLVYDAGMNLNEVKIAGVFENYYGQLFFLTPQGYEEIFLSRPESNCFFVKTDGMGLDLLREKLANVKGLTKVNDAAADRHVIEQFTASLNFVVWFMLFIAAMMDCFIVANFTMTYVQRKTRELTIMRINGFSIRECTLYCAVDLVVTTILGTILGLALGSVLGNAILRTTETPYIQMIREPAAQTYLYSALITGGFSALTNSYALSRIKKLKLSDIS